MNDSAAVESDVMRVALQSEATYVEPMKTYQLNARISYWLRDRLQELADRENRNLTNYIETKLLEIVRAEFGDPPKDEKPPRRGVRKPRK